MGMTHFRFDQALTDSFIRFGYDIHRGDKNWIPPLRKVLHVQLSPEFPFYQRRGNCHMHFLAIAGSQIVGRITAMVNSDLRDKDGTSVGIIGFFECVDDYHVAEELMHSATRWLRDQEGINHIWGPMNFDIWHGYRLMTRGFEQKLFFGEPYNKPYYMDFYERFGFIPKQHWHSVEVCGHENLEKMIAPGAERYGQLRKQGYRFTEFNMRRFSDEIGKLHSVLVKSFGGFLGFSPISPDELERLFRTSRYAFHPGFFTFVYDEQNTLAGFAGAFLELSAAVRAMNGKDNAIARWKFLRRRRQVNRILFHIGGMTPEEAKKRNGLGRAGFYHIMRQILEEGYETVLVALMAEGNRVRGLLKEHVADTRRQYTLYELQP